jgi:hypothetical protein
LNFTTSLESVFNPLKPTLVYITFKNSACTSKTTPAVTITKISWLMLFKEVITVYTENHTEPIHKNVELVIVKAAGTYGYHSTSVG